MFNFIPILEREINGQKEAPPPSKRGRKEDAEKKKIQEYHSLNRSSLETFIIAIIRKA